MAFFVTFLAHGYSMLYKVKHGIDNDEEILKAN
jgi:hypothetical protein